MGRKREGNRSGGKRNGGYGGRGDLPLPRLSPHVRQTDRVSGANIVCLLLSCLRERASDQARSRGGITKGRKVGREEIASSKFKLLDECRWRPPSLAPPSSSPPTEEAGRGRPAAEKRREGTGTVSVVSSDDDDGCQITFCSFMRSTGLLELECWGEMN